MRLVVALLLILFFPVFAISGTVTLMWDPVVHPDLEGYKLYVSYVSGAYSTQMMVDVGDVTSYTWNDLDNSKRNYFVATAYSIYGEESDYSNEVFKWGDLLTPVLLSVNGIEVVGSLTFDEEELYFDEELLELWLMSVP